MQQHCWIDQINRVRVQMKETHNSMDHLLSVVYYQQHKWLICRDLKVVGLVLSLQGGYTKYPCFLYLWDSQANYQHYARQEWLLRQGLRSGSYNVQSHPLVELNKILLPPLHIKFGVMKNFVKAMDKEGFPPGEVLMDKQGETQSWYIWWPSNKRTHEGSNVWWSTERSWTVCLAVTEVGSNKIPGKPPEYGIQEGNWRETKEFPPTQGINVSQTALSTVTLPRIIFQRTVEICVKSWVSTFTKTFALWENTTKASRM